MEQSDVQPCGEKGMVTLFGTPQNKKCEGRLVCTAVISTNLKSCEGDEWGKV